MKPLRWDKAKNEKLRKERGIGFEDVRKRLADRKPLEEQVHPNRSRYPNQRIFVLDIDEYVYMVPFVESADELFLKTIIPSRKLKKLHGKELGHED